MSQQLVRQALTAAAIAALPGIPIARENVAFDKPANSKWAALWFIPNQPSVETLSSIGQDRVDGILQIDVTYPIGTGTDECDADYQSIRASFPAGASYSTGGQTVLIINCGCSQGRRIDSEYRVSVTVRWDALIPR
jgi:hypothetical protein